MAYRDVVLADSPVDYYEMSTSTGTDSGSGSRTLTLAGGITTGVAGRVGNAWTFDGVNDYATMSTFPSLTTAYSIEAWVKAPAAQGWTGTSPDYPTIIRRDGTDIVLVRCRASDLGVQPGQAEVYIDGTTLVSGASYRVDDGNWHHIVYTQSGNAAKLYIDGVERATATTSQTTFNFGTGAAYIGSGNALNNGENFHGSLDEVAIYNTALSAAKVLAHYNGSIVNGGYTAQVMTASATTGDATGVGNVQRLDITHDRTLRNGGDHTSSLTTLSVYAASDLGTYDGAPINRTVLKSAVPAGSDYEVSRSLTFTLSNNPVAVDMHIYRLTSDWDEATVSWATRPSETYVKTVSLPSLSSGNTHTVDISGVDVGYGFALALSWTGPVSFYSSEHATTSARPYVTLVTGPQMDAAPAVTAMTAAATMPNTSVATTRNAHYGAQAMAATASMPNAVGEGVQFITVDVEAEAMDAYAAWPTATGFTLNATVVAQALSATAETLDAAVSVERGPKITATPMGATALWKQPTEVNGLPIVASEVDDKYFQRVFAVPPAVWYRLNDLGSVALDRMAPVTSNNKGYYEGGVQRGQFNAPDGRHSVYFDGTGRIRQEEGGDTFGGSEVGSANSTLSFAIRTDKANSFVAVVADARTGAPSTGLGAKEIYLDNGRIKIRHYPMTNGLDYAELKGFRNLADGQWHHVVIRNVDLIGAGELNVDGTEIYIDGKFEIRRASTNWAVSGFPDFIGSRPERMNPGTTSTYVLPTLPSSLNFVGDMSEVAYFQTALSEYEITRHYYDFMGWTPVEATSMDAFAFTPADSRGRGNQKRALYLWWDQAVDSYFVYGTGVGTNDQKHNTMNFDPVLDGHGRHGVYDLEGYKVFSRGVTMDPTNAAYRDPATDQPSLIDLDTDVDIDDYDVIFFGDWPDEGWEEDRLNITIPNYTAQKERLLSQLWEANNKGIGLMVTHPRLAVDLGLVDRVEFVPTLKEAKSNGSQGNAAGLYDYGSAVKFPWNISADADLGGGDAGAISTGDPMNTDPAYLGFKAYFYEDQNFNNKFRVRAAVDGLTNIPSYMIKDAVYHVDYDIWGDELPAMDLENRLDGLVIGDEFIFHGTNVANNDYYYGMADGFRTGRPFGYYAVPPGNVKAGTVVTTFGATHWKDQQSVANPYANYATTIALSPGDAVGGKAVGGRIFVSFTEQPNRFDQILKADVLPGSPWDNGTATWPTTYKPDTQAQRNWDWSATRTDATNAAVKGELVFVNVQMPDGSYSTIRTGGPGSGRLVSASYVSLFASAILPRWDMTRRGIWWVGRGEKTAEGDMRVAATPMTATAAMPEPVVTAQRDAGYVAEPMRALAQMPRVAEDQSGDVEIVTLPWTASATWTGFSRVISAEPMLAEAEFVENFDMVHASGEQVVLTLHGVDATLYLKEEN